MLTLHCSKRLETLQDGATLHSKIPYTRVLHSEAERSTLVVPNGHWDRAKARVRVEIRVKTRAKSRS